MSQQPRAQTLRFQGAVNRVMRTLLRMPLLSRLPGRRLVLVEVVGRRTGRKFEVPVAHLRQGADLLIGTPFAWGRNLHTGDVVGIVLMGSRRAARVTAYTGREDVMEQYAVICRGNHAFAGFNKIALDKQGEPSAEDLERAWASGARAFRLTPQP